MLMVGNAIQPNPNLFTPSPRFNSPRDSFGVSSDLAAVRSQVPGVPVMHTWAWRSRGAKHLPCRLSVGLECRMCQAYRDQQKAGYERPNVRNTACSECNIVLCLESCFREWHTIPSIAWVDYVPEGLKKGKAEFRAKSDGKEVGSRKKKMTERVAQATARMHKKNRG